MRSRRLKATIRSVFAVLALLLVASPALAQAYGGTLRVGLADDPPELDPHRTAANASRTILHNIFATLFEVDENLQVVPGVVSDWTVTDDGLEYVFELHPGVLFHDGTPLDADAVVFNFERMLDPGFGSPRKAELEFVDEVEAVDELTVRVSMSQPFAAFLPALASWTGMMVSPTAIAEVGNDGFEEVLIGAGPFRFVERIRDDRVVIERFDDYFKEGLPYLDQVIYRPFVDGDSRVLNLESGSLHIVNTIPGRNVQALQQHDEITVSIIGGLGYRGIYINGESADLGDPLRRQALSACIDRQVIVDTIFGDAAVPGFGPYSPATFVVDEDDPVPPRDVERARELLAQAGVPDGFSFTLYIVPSEEEIRVASMINAMCAEVGIQVDIQQIEFGTGLARMGDGNYTAFSVELSPRNDPDLSAYPWFHSTSTNWGRVYNDDLDDLLTRARASVDQAERRELYRATNEIFAQEVPYLFLYHMAEIKAFRNEVQGFRHIPDSMMRFEDVWLAD